MDRRCSSLRCHRKVLLWFEVEHSRSQGYSGVGDMRGDEGLESFLEVHRRGIGSTPPPFPGRESGKAEVGSSAK